MIRILTQPIAAIVTFAFLGRVTAIVTRLHIIPFFPELMERFDLTYAHMGILYSAFFVAYGLLLIPMGFAVDRYSPRLLFGIGWLTAGLGIAAVAWAPTYGWMLAARMIESVGVSMLYPASMKLVAVGATPEQRGKAVGLLEAGAGVGMLLAVSAAPALTAWFSLPVVFTLAALLSLPALLALRLLPDGRPRAAAAGGAPARSETPAQTQPGAGPQPDAPARALDLARQPRFWYYAVQAMMAMAVVNGVVGWLPTYLKLSATGPVISGLTMALITGGQVLSALPAGSLSDLLGRRTPVIHLGSALMVLFPLAALFGLATGPVLLLLALLIGMGIGFSGVSMGALGTELFGRRWAGTVISTAAAAAQASSALAGVLFGWIADQTGSFTSIWMLCLAIMLVRWITTNLMHEPAASRPALRPRLTPSIRQI